MSRKGQLFGNCNLHFSQYFPEKLFEKVELQKKLENQDVLSCSDRSRLHFKTNPRFAALELTKKFGAREHSYFDFKL